MNAQPALDLLKLLADDTRWRLIGALRRSDYQVGELVNLVKLPQNLVSYHLGILRQAGLVQLHRSDADARVVYYGLDMAALGNGYRQLGQSLQVAAEPAQQAFAGTTVVFLCTANSARSQMAEGWLRHLSSGQISARSAGTAPDALHPLSVQVMAEAGVDISQQQAKGLAALASLMPDVVVTVCDLAREECAELPTASARLHWSIGDPARVAAGSKAQVQAFRAARDQLRLRVEALLALLPQLLAPAGRGGATPPL